MATNALANSTSPYLLQHASNPVHWYPWGEEALHLAAQSNRLLLVSIGYSACHWCHVMEHECFENEEVAAVMNQHFVCIKVDREERPDLDQVYMAAVQLMTQQGGWPLNCVALPSGEPVWGGTYFPKNQWEEALRTLAEMWQSEPQKMKEYAEMVRQGMVQSEQLVVATNGLSWKLDDLDAGVLNAKRRFDMERGGPSRAPKFPLPNNYLFFHQYALQTADQQVAEQVERTLLALVRGGIYDQIGGGWYRYSVDALWKVPHFEKMLYDNAQLIQLLAVYLCQSPNVELQRALQKSLDFLYREMMLPTGAFGAALDADSEGHEGLYYTWTHEEWKALLGGDADLAADYFGLDERGAWEGRFIPLRTASDNEFASKLGVSPEAFHARCSSWVSRLLAARSKRIRPGFDHKALVSWNAMLVRALVEAHHALGSTREKEMALQVGQWLQHQTAPNGTLYHTAIGNHQQMGFLEDQAWAIDAAIALAQLTGESLWWEQAKRLAEAALAAFGDLDGDLLFYSQDTWVVRQREVSDNVIPASNSQMARNLYMLGLVYGRTEWLERAERMLNHFAESFVRYAEGYSNWGLLAMDLLYPRAEVVVVGLDALKVAAEIRKSGFWHGWVLPCSEPSTLPLIEGRWKNNGTWIYVCERGTCKLPVQSWAEAKEQLP